MEWVAGVCTNNKIRLLKFVLFSIGVLLLGLLYYVICKFGYGIHCPMEYILAVDCPFCGLTRMCIAIIEFRFKEAFYYNIPAFILLPVILYTYLRIGITYIKTGKIVANEYENKMCVVMLLIVLICGLLRNIG